MTQNCSKEATSIGESSSGLYPNSGEATRSIGRLLVALSPECASVVQRRASHPVSPLFIMPTIFLPVEATAGLTTKPSDFQRSGLLVSIGP